MSDDHSEAEEYGFSCPRYDEGGYEDYEPP
jgi:hypothetical protein